MLAMAMQESTHLDVSERDASKDARPDKAANATIFNLSVVSNECAGKCSAVSASKECRRRTLAACSTVQHRPYSITGSSSQLSSATISA